MTSRIILLQSLSIRMGSKWYPGVQVGRITGAGEVVRARAQSKSWKAEAVCKEGALGVMRSSVRIIDHNSVS